MSNEEKTIWKSHPDYPFLQANQFGEVRTIDRTVKCKNGGKLFVKGRILKQQRDRYGYMYVQFSSDRKRVTLKVHRIVLACFRLNPDNLPEVNHIDCNRSNNRLDNLEWCSSAYNISYREKYGKASSRPVFAVNIETGEVLHFESRGEAERKLNISHQDIFAVIKGTLNTIHGYWFTEDENEITEGKIQEIKANIRFSGGVIAINLCMKNALYFESQKVAAYQLGVNQGNMNSVLKGRYNKTSGYWFTYADENAVEKTRAKFGNEVAEKVKKLISENCN